MMAVEGEQPRQNRSRVATSKFAGGGEQGSGGGSRTAAATVSVHIPGMNLVTEAVDDLVMLDLANNDVGNVRRGQRFIKDFGRAAHMEMFPAAVAMSFKEATWATYANRQSPFGRRDTQKTAEVHLSFDQLEALVHAARVAGLGTIVMPLDEASVRRCAGLDVDTWKIASDDIGDLRLFEAIAETRRPVIISADRAGLDDVENLVALFEERGFDYTFKHAVSVHPTSDGAELVAQRKARLVIVFTPSAYPPTNSLVKARAACG